MAAMLFAMADARLKILPAQALHVILLCFSPCFLSNS